MLIAAATTTGGHTTSAFPSLLLIIALALGALWLIVLRPQRRKQRIQQNMQSELAVGDEVLTAGGVYGKVTQIGEDEVHVEIAPNVEVRLARRAIAVQLTEHEPDEEIAEPDGPSDKRSESAVDAVSDEEDHG